MRGPDLRFLAGSEAVTASWAGSLEARLVWTNSFCGSTTVPKSVSHEFYLTGFYLMQQAGIVSKKYN